MNPEKLSEQFETAADYHSRRRELVTECEQLVTGAKSLIQEFNSFFFNLYHPADSKHLPGVDQGHLLVTLKRGVEDAVLGEGSITARVTPISTTTILNSQLRVKDRGRYKIGRQSTLAYSVTYDFQPSDPTAEKYAIDSELFHSVPLKKTQTAGGSITQLEHYWPQFNNSNEEKLILLSSRMKEEIGEKMLTSGVETLQMLTEAASDKDRNIQIAAVLLNREASKARGELPTGVEPATIE